MKAELGRHLLSSGSWALAGKIITTIAGVVLSALIARLLSPEDMGNYFLILSFVTVFAVVGRFGMAETVVRLVASAIGANESGRARTAIYKAFLISTGVTVTIAILLNFGGGDWVAHHLFKATSFTELMPYISLWIILLVLHLLIAETFRGFHDIRYATIFGGALKNVFSVLLIGSIWMLSFEIELRHVIILSLVSLALSNLLAGLFLRAPIAKLDAATSMELNSILSMAWPFMLNGLVIFAIVRANLWVLGAYVDKSEVALYGASIQLVTIVTTPLLIVNAVVPPIIARMYFKDKNNGELEGILRSVTTIAGIPSLAMLAVFIFFGGSILAILYGEFYRNAALILIFLSIGQSANVWTGPCGALLKMTDNQQVLLGINLVFGLLSIACSILVAPRYGATGVGAVSGIALLLQNLAILVVAKFRTDILTLIHLNVVDIRTNFNRVYRLSLNKA